MMMMAFGRYLAHSLALMTQLANIDKPVRLGRRFVIR